MFRTGEACVAIADVNIQELADVATPEKDTTVVMSTMKRSHLR
jgi:hypothetical protein